MTLITRCTESAEEDDRALDLATAVWGAPPLITHVVRALRFAGGYVAVTLDPEIGPPSGPAIEPVGMALGFVGVRPDDPHRPSPGRLHGHLHLHSHLAAVRPDQRGQGIGRILKFHQRSWCLERGITTVTWTFDPLQAANARFNLHHLGARGIDYLANLYGPMDDDLNRGDESDRLLVSWALDDPAVAARAARRTAPPDDASVAARADTGPTSIDPDRAASPTVGGPTSIDPDTDTAASPTGGGSTSIDLDTAASPTGGGSTPIDPDTAASPTDEEPIPDVGPDAAVVVRRTDDGPRVESSTAPIRLVQVPADIQGIRRSDPALARRWRVAVRDESLRALADGLRPFAFTTDDAYVWSAPT